MATGSSIPTIVTGASRSAGGPAGTCRNRQMPSPDSGRGASSHSAAGARDVAVCGGTGGATRGAPDGAGKPGEALGGGGAPCADPGTAGAGGGEAGNGLRSGAAGTPGAGPPGACAGGGGTDGSADGRAGTAGADGDSAGGDAAGRGTPAPVPRVPLDSYVPSVSMNPCPLTSQVAATVPSSI
ncbi:hypothetical protein GCM10019017_74480 [Streptomyces showdoensis]